MLSGFDCVPHRAGGKEQRGMGGECLDDGRKKEIRRRVAGLEARRASREANACRSTRPDSSHSDSPDLGLTSGESLLLNGPYDFPHQYKPCSRVPWFISPVGASLGTLVPMLVPHSIPPRCRESHVIRDFPVHRESATSANES